MAYFYVKDGGTATGDAGRYATQQTGSFASLGAANYYDSIGAAMVATTVPDLGDWILISDASTTHTYTADEIWTTSLSGGAWPSPLKMVSVSDTAIDSYSPGAKETNSSGDMRHNGIISTYGIDWVCAGGIPGPQTTNRDVRFFLCDVQSTGQSIQANDNGTVLHIEHVTSTAASLSTRFRAAAGGMLNFRGVTVAGTPTTIFANYGASYGARINAFGCDFSTVTTQDASGTDNNTTQDVSSLYFERCKRNTSQTNFIFQHTPIRPVLDATVSHSGNTNAEEEYYLGMVGCHYEMVTDTAFYRDSTTSFPSAETVSLKYVIDSKAAFFDPAIIRFPVTRYVPLSNTASDKVTLYLLTSATLTDTEMWGVMHYADGTTRTQGNFVNSSSNTVSGKMFLDPFSGAGTTLTTNTEAWTGRTTENRYQLDFDTSGDPGADCVVRIDLFIAKPSITVYICPTFGLS